jgi:signal transduction histidine kinase
MQLQDVIQPFLPTTRVIPRIAAILLGAVVLGGLAVLGTVHHQAYYLLFHALTELLSIVVALSIYLLVWNTRASSQNGYLHVLGIAYLFIGLIDLLHTLAYKGMGVFPHITPNPATQLWIAGRILEVGALLLAPGFITRRPNVPLLLLAFGAVAAGLLAAIAGGVFPVCFADGLTPFKKITEYVLCAGLLTAIGLLWRQRQAFDPVVFRWMIASALMLIATELAFTEYAGVYDIANLIGHLCKLTAYYFSYKAIVEISLTRPYDSLFRAVAQREHALAQERAFLASSIELLPIPLILHHADGSVLMQNPASATFVQDLAGGDVSRLEWLTADTRVPVPRAEWPLQRALRGEVVHGAESLLRAEGAPDVPLLAFAAPVRVQDELVGAVVALQDISALKAADRAKDDFLAVLSHEMLSPTTSMLGWAQLLLEMELADDTRNAAEIIERNAWRQRRLVDDLLDISRITHGKIVLDLERVELWTLVRQQVEMMQRLADDRGLALRVELPETPVVITADPTRIGQVISNLLTNAMKFTESGGAITVTGACDGAWAEVRVRDTGKGIPPDQLPGIFDRYHQLQRDKRTGGLGLGLALVKGLVELHHGRVTAESTPGEGSTFTISLPVPAEVEA